MVSVTRGLSSNGLRCPSGPGGRTCGPSPRSTATSVGCAGSSDELGVSRSAATSVGRGQRQRQVGAASGAARRAAARSTTCAGRRRWRRRRSPARRSSRRHRRRARCPAGAIRSARLGPWRGAHPHRRRHRDRLGHRQRPAQVDRLLGRQRHASPRTARRRGRRRSPGRPSSSEPRSHCATAEPGGGPGTSTVCRRLTGWANPLASYWVTVRSVMPNCTPGEPSSVRRRGDPHPRRLAVGQRDGQRLARLVEPHRAGAVDGRRPRAVAPARRRRWRSG